MSPREWWWGYATAQKNCPRKNTVRELASEPQHTSKKNSKNTHIRLTTLTRSPWRRTILCHHPLEDARKAHGRPHITPPRHSFSNHTARYSLFLMNMRVVLHHSGYFAVPIDALSFNPFGRRDDLKCLGKSECLLSSNANQFIPCLAFPKREEHTCTLMLTEVYLSEVERW